MSKPLILVQVSLIPAAEGTVEPAKLSIASASGHLGAPEQERKFELTGHDGSLFAVLGRLVTSHLEVELHHMQNPAEVGLAADTARAAEHKDLIDLVGRMPVQATAEAIAQMALELNRSGLCDITAHEARLVKINEFLTKRLAPPTPQAPPNAPPQAQAS